MPSIAISDDHVALGETVADFLTKRDARGAARALLEAPEEALPEFWAELAGLGWLGLHLPEEHGGSGFGLEELVVVVEQLGRGICPGPFVPTVVASATLADAGASDRLAGLADGSLAAGVALEGDLQLSGASLTGTAVVLSGGVADVLVLAVGDDVAVVDVTSNGVTREVPPNLDPSRRAARLRFDGAQAEVLVGAASSLVDHARLLFAAEAVGVARECTESAAAYAKDRQQFGRPIAMFQAVKHHCANMLVATELATGLVWDAARADVAERSMAIAMAATVAIPAADECANLNIQVHGGIGFTWEHHAHLYLRRAAAIAAVVDVEAAAVDVVDRTRAGETVTRGVDLPPEAEPLREEARAFVERVRGLDATAQRAAMIETGYVAPHWPKPWGRSAGPVEQLVIEEEFAAAGVRKPAYGITGWVILTLIQHGTDDQVQRWVPRTLEQEWIWCQLFSEPDAGSDAAGVKTKATKVDGGWLVNGQKVWTSGAHVSRWGFATVRTNPDVPKHEGITVMVIDMEADGVEVRPLRMTTGQSEFNEVFFDDVFVADEEVIGPVDGGWTVARATLGNESVSIGGGDGGMAFPGAGLIPPLDGAPERVYGGAARVGRYIAQQEAVSIVNLRSVHRAVAGGGPSAEGAITKLALSEIGHEAAALLSGFAGPEGAFLDGPGAMSGMLVLLHRAMSIAGGTSEIKRNQIGERLLGLPRDPLIK
jgi:alkylation response protein AidB-like acyl-CoA dehydrogenase